MSDHKGARLVVGTLPPADHLIADPGAMTAPGSAQLEAKGIQPRIPSGRSREVPFNDDTALYRQRHKVEHLFAGASSGSYPLSSMT